MRKTLYLATAAALVLMFSFAVIAQKSVQTGVGDGGSPHFKSDWDIKGAHITVEYGRPYLKKRAVGKDVAPYGQPWRTGADQATTIMSDKPLKFGQITLAAGTTYTINTVPKPGNWDLVIGKLSEPGQWGIPYQSELEIGRTPMKQGMTTAPVEQVTISIGPSPTGGILRIEWGTTSESAFFTIG